MKQAILLCIVLAGCSTNTPMPIAPVIVEQQTAPTIAVAKILPLTKPTPPTFVFQDVKDKDVVVGMTAENVAKLNDFIVYTSNREAAWRLRIEQANATIGLLQKAK